MGWTNEQEAAISARGASLLVSAAAGSGKTSVLVERLIRQLSDTENRIPADRMIVVTFTKDAATEMKQRLTSALAQLIEKEPDNQWLNQQQLLLQSAKIATIHSFCFELIRDNIQELELTGSFRIMDETEAKLMLSSAVSELVTDYYEKYPELTEKLYDKFCFRDDKAIEELITDIYNFISSVPYGSLWLKNVCEGYSPEGDTYEKFSRIYSQYISEKAEKAEELSAECTSLASQADLNEKCMNIVDSEYAAISKIRELFDSPKTLKEKREEYREPEFATLRMGKETDPELKLGIQTVRDEYKKIVREQIGACEEILEFADEDIKTHFEVLTILEKMISELEQNLWRKKTEKCCIGFSDAETLAVKLLSSVDEKGNITKSRLADELSVYYKIIMIDEFQDTNNNQDLIFKLLSHNGTADRTGDNMFMVGDVKQSIYRFRLANPKNFINTMDNSVEYNPDNKGVNSFIKLNRNFRSSSDVISFVNFIFEGIMSREVGEIVYDDGEKLIQGTTYTERDRSTEVALIFSEDEKTNDMAVYTADKIASMLENKAQVDNKDGKSTRDCRRRDFCILLRRKDDAAAYMSELSKRGIAAYSEETSGYLSSREISILLNLLRITDNPLIDTSFAAVLLSPMFMLTDDEMAILRLEDRKAHIYNIVCSIAEGKHSDSVSDAMKLKMLNVYDTIKELRMLAATMSLAELIRRIYDRTDFISVVRLYEDGDKKRANLRALLEYAKIYEDSSDDGLSGFLRYIDRIVRMNGDFKQGQTVSTTEDVVMIKTIHKSKGLEFPFVFLCETHVQFNRLDSLGNIQLNFENGIGFRLQNRREFKRYTTLPFEVLKRINVSDALSEEMRLLYVALTRAREKLFVPLQIAGKQKNKLNSYAKNICQYQGITPKLAASATSMEDWLLMTLITHKNGNILRNLSGYDMFWTSASDFKLNFTEIYPEEKDEKSEEKETEKEQILPDEKLVRDIIRDFENSYDLSRPDLQAKFSVSEISKDHSSFGVKLSRPEFMTEHTKMTGTERGTVIHSILQHADFMALAENPETEIMRIAKKGFITQHQAEQTDPKYIRNFADSDIFRRAVNSVRIEKERKFLVKISDLELSDERFSGFSGKDSMLQGIIDLYFEEEDGLVLVDYKTDSVSDISKLIENYSLQLALYKAALEKIENKKVKRTVIYSLALGEAADVDI